MGLFKFKKRNVQEITSNIDDVLLSAILSQDSISCEQALNIPAVARCVNLISDTVSMIPIKLYREDITDGKRKTVETCAAIYSTRTQKIHLTERSLKRL